MKIKESEMKNEDELKDVNINKKRINLKVEENKNKKRKSITKQRKKV